MAILKYVIICLFSFYLLKHLTNQAFSNKKKFIYNTPY